jgi:hypothetical protein
MRFSSLYPAAFLAAAALIVPQAASAAVTDPVAYKESIGCAATMVVATVMLGGTEKNPTSAEMVEASKKTREFGTSWLMRAGTFNPGGDDQIGKEFTTEAERQTAEYVKAPAGEAFDNGFRADFRRCLTRGKELGIN